MNLKATTSAPIINYLSNTIIGQAVAEFDPKPFSIDNNNHPDNAVTDIATELAITTSGIVDRMRAELVIPETLRRYLIGDYLSGEEKYKPHFYRQLEDLLQEGVHTGITMAASIANLYLFADDTRTLPDAAAFLHTKNATTSLLQLANTRNGLLGGESSLPGASKITITPHGYLPNSLTLLSDRARNARVFEFITVDGDKVVLSKNLKAFLHKEKTANGQHTTDGCPARKRHHEPSDLALDIARELCIDPEELAVQPSPIKTAAVGLAACIDLVIEENCLE